MGTFRRKVRGKKLKTWSAKFTFNGRLHQKHGLPDRDAAQFWVDSTRLALRRGAIGYVKTKTAAQVEPLVNDYVDTLVSNGRDDKYCEVARMRLKKLAREIPWQTTGDLTADGFERWRASKPKWYQKPIGPKTLNHYLDHAVQFGDYLCKVRKVLAINPFADLPHARVVSDGSYRRAATLDEVTRLIAAAPPDRALVYYFLVYAPLRREALERITWGDLHLEGDRPTLVLPASLSKTRKEALMAIRADLAERLKAHRGDAGQHDPVFGRVARMRALRKDLAAAGIPFDDGKGRRRFDLHAFRKTVVRILKDSGVSLDEAHTFLQHRDRQTTARYYDDDRVAPGVTVAAEKMPAIAISGVGAQMGASVQSEPRKAGK